MDIHDYSPAATARRFESGTPPIPAAYAAHAGIELVRGLGVEKTAAHVAALANRLLGGLDELGATAATPRNAALRGPLVAVRASDEHALVAALRADGIVTSSRDGNVRVSFHAYNTAEDVDAVLATLARMRTLL
jgi:selenocysteine lyase/cysteine desulfurase